jgi:hypothetical protein
MGGFPTRPPGQENSWLTVKSDVLAIKSGLANRVSDNTVETVLQAP